MTANQDIKERLFEAMRRDFETMAAYGDDENKLKQEIETADAEILAAYKDTFLN